MYSALPAARCDVATQAGQAGSGAHDSEHPETIETRLWLEEHDWLYGLLRSEDNVSPTFRFPDLISASVSLVFTHQDALSEAEVKVLLYPPTAGIASHTRSRCRHDPVFRPLPRD